MLTDFVDNCCSSLENENTLAIVRRKHFPKAATERCSSNLCLAALNWNERLYSCISRVFISVVKQLCYITTFFKTRLDGYWKLLNLLWPEPCRVMFVYGSKSQGIKKTLLIIFPTVNMEWPNVWAPKKFFGDFKSKIF